MNGKEKRLKRNLASIRSKDGMALLLVLCLFAILIAIGAAVFFAAASASRTSVQETSGQQAALSAKSACEVFLDMLDDEASGLNEALNNTAVGNEIPVTASLPENMGSVEGSFQRLKADSGILSLTIEVREAKYTLRASLSAASAAEGKSAWRLEKYLPEGVK